MEKEATAVLEKALAQERAEAQRQATRQALLDLIRVADALSQLAKDPVVLGLLFYDPDEL